MERKAIENMDAARLLMQGEDPSPNAAVSRAYYAAYPACWALLESEGCSPEDTPQGRYFRHKRLPDLAVEHGVLSEAQGEQLAFLESQRVVADYSEDHVSEKMGHQCVADAQTLVALLDDDS